MRRVWRAELLEALVIATLFAFSLDVITGEEPPPAGGKKPSEAKNAAGKPRRDPADIPFRRAPMSAAVRSVHIPLATNVHLAFDTELLRTHAAWTGPALNLWGTAYHAAKDRFYCDQEGVTLWTNAPVFPWTYRRPDKATGRHEDTPPARRFRGVSTKDGVTSLLYDLTLQSGQVVEVRETPRHRPDVPPGVIERRFEIGPCEQSLTLLAHAESGKTLPTPPGLAVVLVELNGRVLLVAARGDCNLKLQSATEDVAYDVVTWKEEKNDSVPLRAHHTGREARCYVRIPVHEKPVVVEVLSIVASTADEAVAALKQLPKIAIVPARFDAVRAESKASRSPRARVFSGEKAISPPAGDAHYRIERFPLPREIEMQVTGMDFLPDGELAVATWLGDVYIVQGATNAPAAATYRRFARGLCEPGGLKVIDGEIYVVQKQELTRLKDRDGDGEADLFECLTQDWGHTGNYHDFTFGPALDKAGNFYLMRNGNRGVYDVPRMGWCLKVNRNDWSVEPFCSGLRSPNSFGSHGPDGDIFMGDNHGNWIAANTLAHMQRGRFYGFPSSYPAPKEDYAGRPDRSPAPPAIWFPYKLVKSVSGIETIPDGRFGPFEGQLMAGDFQNAVVTRVVLEKVNGEWQGAVFPFAKGFESGVNRLAFGPDGRLYVGGCKNRAWAAVAPKEWSLERIAYTGRTPFEVRNVRALPDGFELAFTQPVEAATAGNTDSYDVLQYNYRYHEKYGSPEYDHDGRENSATPIPVVNAAVSSDRRTVKLTLSGWKAGFVTMVRCLDVANDAGQNLRHDTFWYTLNAVPGG